MSSQPSLDIADSPKWNLFPKTEQGSENKNAKRNCSKSQTDRGTTDGMVFGGRLNPRRGKTNQVRIKIAEIKEGDGKGSAQDEKEPREMLPIG
jgi:hypothetical protein